MDMVYFDDRWHPVCRYRTALPCLKPPVSANIQIPTLCYLKDVNQIGACRMCLVDTGARARCRLLV